MIEYDPAIQSAIEQRKLVYCDMFWWVPRDRESGDPVPDGYHSRKGVRSFNVLPADTGTPESREFVGTDLVNISSIARVSGLSIQTVTVTLLGVSDRVNDLIRTYEPKLAPVEVFRGWFSTITRQLVAPAVSRFVGFVDDVEIKRAAEGSQGNVILTCRSDSQELTRYNPDTRSDASQKLRSATDNFFADATVVGGWELFWGSAQGKIQTSKKKSPGIDDFIKAFVSR